jgi:hypothetical protein
MPICEGQPSRFDEDSEEPARFLNFPKPDWWRKVMFRSNIAVSCLLVGVAITLTGFAWSHLFTPGSYWSSAEQQEYAAAVIAFKSAVHRPGRRADQPPDSKLIAAQSHFDGMQAKLDRAIAMHHHGGTALRAIGVAVACTSGLLLWAAHRAEC